MGEKNIDIHERKKVIITGLNYISSLQGFKR